MRGSDRNETRMTAPIIYWLPWAPSSNEAHVHRNAKIKHGPKAGKQYTARMLSSEAREFRSAVEIEVRRGHRAPPRLAGRLTVGVMVCPTATSNRADIDNRVKQTLDALQAAGVFLDDAQVDLLPVLRGEIVEFGRIIVSVIPYDTEFAALIVKALGLPLPWQVNFEQAITRNEMKQAQLKAPF